MLTGLKVLYLAFKCVFYGAEHNANGITCETEFLRS